MSHLNGTTRPVLASERFSASKGTKVRNFEILGFRPGYDEWAELIAVTNDLEMVVEIDSLQRSPCEFAGFLSIVLLKPGDVRPVDVIQTPETVVAFSGRLVEWFADLTQAVRDGRFDADRDRLEELNEQAAVELDQLSRLSDDDLQVDGQLTLQRVADTVIES